jgi:prolipoprotein diacylglyceryltransferase
MYAVFRFFEESLRGDSGGLHLSWLTFAQATSAIVFAAGLALMRWRIKIEAAPGTRVCRTP